MKKIFIPMAIALLASMTSIHAQAPATPATPAQAPVNPNGPLLNSKKRNSVLEKSLRASPYLTILNLKTLEKSHL
jgi:hypothetical protein